MKRILEELLRVTRRPALRAPQRADRDMTLLEIMIVLALIGLVVAALSMSLSANFQKGRVQTAKIAVGRISQAAQQFMIEHNSDCPTSIQDLVDNRNLPKVPRDPWGKDFILTCPGTGDPDGADVVSGGPDKQEGTDDDIKSWEI